MCPDSEFFWSVLSRIRSEYGEIQGISSCSVQMRENTDEKNSEYGHSSRSVCYSYIAQFIGFVKELPYFDAVGCSRTEKCEVQQYHFQN